MSTHEMHRLNSCWGLGSRSTPHAAILLRPQSASGPLLRVDGFKLSNCRLICGKVLQIYHVESDFAELTLDFIRNDRFGQGDIRPIHSRSDRVHVTCQRQVHGGGNVGTHRASLQAVIQWPLISNINLCDQFLQPGLWVLGALASARCCTLKRRAERAFSVGSSALPQALINRVRATDKCLIGQLASSRPLIAAIWT